MSGPNPNGKMEEFAYDPDNFDLTEEMRSAYDKDGGYVIKGLFSKAEIDHINKAVTGNEEFIKHDFKLADGRGRASSLVLWNQPGNDVTGMVGRCEKLVNMFEKILGGEVYHYHTKLMTKMPRTGGSHIWHQDYGYWYKNGCLRPDLATAYIALDPCVIENGCLQVLKGSHKYGRIDHDIHAGQQQIDLVRLAEVQKRCEWIYAQLQPGDALFFHCNLIHTADKNDSDMRRWSFLCSYNKADNDPIFKHHHPNYTPLHKVPNSAILSCMNFTDLSGKDFMDENTDKTIRANIKETGVH